MTNHLLCTWTVQMTSTPGLCTTNQLHKGGILPNPNLFLNILKHFHVSCIWNVFEMSMANWLNTFIPYLIPVGRPQYGVVNMFVGLCVCVYQAGAEVHPGWAGCLCLHDSEAGWLYGRSPCSGGSLYSPAHLPVPNAIRVNSTAQSIAMTVWHFYS